MAVPDRPPMASPERSRRSPLTMHLPLRGRLRPRGLARSGGARWRRRTLPLALALATTASLLGAQLAAAQPAPGALVLAQGGIEAPPVQITDRKAVNVVLGPSGTVVTGSLSYPLLF